MVKFKKQTRNRPPFNFSKRFWSHMCRYSIMAGTYNDQPDWMNRVEYCYFNLTREGLSNG